MPFRRPAGYGDRRQLRPGRAGHGIGFLVKTVGYGGGKHRAQAGHNRFPLRLREIFQGAYGVTQFVKVDQGQSILLISLKIQMVIQ
jgi:hypothetical protein